VGGGALGLSGQSKVQGCELPTLTTHNSRSPIEALTVTNEKDYSGLMAVVLGNAHPWQGTVGQWIG